MLLKELKNFQIYQWVDDLYLNNIKLIPEDWSKYDDYEVKDIVAYTDDGDSLVINVYIKDKGEDNDSKRACKSLCMEGKR